MLAERRAAAALNDHQNLAALTCLAGVTRARGWAALPTGLLDPGGQLPRHRSSRSSRSVGSAAAQPPSLARA